MSLKLIKARKKEIELLRQGNWGKPKALYLQQQKRKFSHKIFGWEVSDSLSV